MIERFEKFSVHQIKNRAKCTINKTLHCGPRLSDSACVECMNRHYQALSDAETGEISDSG